MSTNLIVFANNGQTTNNSEEAIECGSTQARSLSSSIVNCLRIRHLRRLEPKRVIVRYVESAPVGQTTGPATSLTSLPA
jgi:hypothetical protein